MDIVMLNWSRSGRIGGVCSVAFGTSDNLFVNELYSSNNVVVIAMDNNPSIITE